MPFLRGDDTGRPSRSYHTSGDAFPARAGAAMPAGAWKTSGSLHFEARSSSFALTNNVYELPGVSSLKVKLVSVVPSIIVLTRRAFTWASSPSSSLLKTPS